MRAALTFLAVCLTVALAGPAAAEDGPVSETVVRPFLGVRLEPLPELLAKHLQLASGEGLLIRNVVIDSPADKTGLEPDDIILACDDKPVRGHAEFVEQIRGTGVDHEVTLEIIHNGERQSLQVRLAPAPAETRPDQWKRPLSDPIDRGICRGRTFRWDPGDGYWQEVPHENVPGLRGFRHPFLDVPGVPENRLRFFHEPEQFMEQLHEPVENLQQRVEELEKAVEALRKQVESGGPKKEDF